MKDKEVLQKAIEKVSTLKDVGVNVDPKWKLTIVSDDMFVLYGHCNKEKGVKEFVDSFFIDKHDDLEFLNMWTVNGFLYLNDFAKAFWGEGSSWLHEMVKSVSKQDESETMKDWEVHLQQMVLCENPIDYLRKFIKNEE